MSVLFEQRSDFFSEEFSQDYMKLIIFCMAKLTKEYFKVKSAVSKTFL